MQKRISGLVFDLDGTLVDSLDDIVLHLNAALAERDLPPRSRVEISEWVGYGADHLVVRAVPHPEMVADTLLRFREHYAARPVVHTHVFEDLVAVLDEIAKGRKLAVLSNKPHDLTVRVCEQLLGRWPFAVIAGQRSGKAHKPDPAALLEVAAELAIDPKECVMIGDSEVDVATGRAANVSTIAVSWGLRAVDILAAAGPDHLVHSPSELRELFARVFV
jgi:phosphoglycolate phosphatase